MANLKSVFEIGRQALNVQQAALDRTSHNIANVNTEGYSRQRLSLAADTVLISGGFKYATGVAVESIERVRDKFIDKQIQVQTNTLGWFDTYKSAFERLETIINEPSDSGISSALTQFFDAWHGLASDPENVVARENVLMRAEVLAGAFRSTRQRLDQLKQELYGQFVTDVNRLNDMLDELAEMNRIIINSGGQGPHPDLLDKRDMLVNQLSKLADIRVSEQNDGSVIISHHGKVVLQNVTVTHLIAGENGGQLGQSHWENESAGAGFGNGKLAALSELHDTRIDELFAELDTLADTIVQAVNEQHRLGSSIEEVPTKGYNFFDPASAGAADLRISDDIRNNVLRIAASLDGNSGDGENALRIGQIVNETLLNDGTTRIHDYFSNIVSTVGAQSAHYRTMAEGQELFVEQLTMRQEQVAGVSLDEEMTNLIEFQRAYQAAARVISTVDEMIETLLNTV